ncbi:MAG: phosphoribosylformylglycinamidine cyclo-ligase, partial [Halodesulfurarchaeum sp.]
MTDDHDELTYAKAGVELEESEGATAALVGALSESGSADGYAGLVDIGDRYLGLTTDGVGTKLLVAEAI